ncbi:MAG TPA: polysaccharide deacetylase family protein [Holophagaceae bacterium]|nr:polysaccharide deacetylase family protein [Holophagaceae bacterium]
MKPGPRKRLPLSFDWEDWFQLCCPPFDAPEALDRFECRLPLATDLALELCEDLGAKATWFCLADQARRHPGLVRRIADAGHAIALHGLTHRRAFELGRAEFVSGLREAKALLEDLSGQPVTAFRAPEWSLRGVAEDYWRELPALGFHIDSSRVPLAALGDTAWPRRPHHLCEGLWELPPPVLGLGPLKVPLWGWGVRVLPEPLLRAAIHGLAAEDAGTPLVIHPWELDTGQPGLPEASRGHRFAHGAGLRRCGQRLRRLWRGLELVPLERWVAEAEAASLPALMPAPRPV